MEFERGSPAAAAHARDNGSGRVRAAAAAARRTRPPLRLQARLTAAPARTHGSGVRLRSALPAALCSQPQMQRHTAPAAAAARQPRRAAPPTAHPRCPCDIWRTRWRTPPLAPLQSVVAPLRSLLLRLPTLLYWPARRVMSTESAATAVQTWRWQLYRRRRSSAAARSREALDGGNGFPESKKVHPMASRGPWNT